MITDRWAYRYPTACTPWSQSATGSTTGDSLVDTVEIHYLNHGTVPDWLDVAVDRRRVCCSTWLPVRTHVRQRRHAPDRRAGCRRLHQGQLGPGRVPGRRDRVLGRYPPPRGGQRSRPWLTCSTSGRTRSASRRRPACQRRSTRSQFLAANYLRHNALLVRIRTGGFGPDALGLDQLRHLRRIIPPHEAVLIVIEMPVVAGLCYSGPR